MRPIATHEEAETAQELDAMLSSHRRWVSRLNRALICGTPPDQDMIAEDAHRLCSLGRWLETRAEGLLADKAFLADLDRHHRLAHDQAREMLLASAAHEPIGEATYDAFLATLAALSELIEGAYDEAINKINATDPLTGAQNRAKMQDQLNALLAKTREGLASWIVMIDLDHFKSINDDHGHEIGDQVLKGFAAVVREHIRAQDLFFRYGGEEFLLSISGLDRELVSRIAERLRVAISRETFKAANGAPFHVTASFGITRLQPGIELGDAISAADAAMYAAKRAGRNMVKFDAAAA